MKLKTKNGRFLFLMLSVALMLAVVMAAAPQSASAAKCKFKHKVQAGETLTSIADLYQTDWKEIAEANDLTEPYVLTVGQILCIPDGTKPSDDPPDPTDPDDDGGDDTNKATLTATASFTHVYVEVQNFPKNKPYFVRVGTKPGNYDFIKIGRLKTNDKGNFAGYFRLPDGYAWNQELGLCLKDPITDLLYCVEYDNPWSALEAASYACAKPGR